MSVRFAPSPTGTFHVGNLRTAWISHAWACLLKQPWVARFEDIDLPRVVPGAQDQQLSDMAKLGLIPDQIATQSQNRTRHWSVFTEFLARDWIYPCDCTRKDLRANLDSSASAPHTPQPIYTGRCRNRVNPLRTDLPSLAWRLRGDASDGTHDIIIARSASQLTGGKPSAQEFVPAYNWACAIDDYDGQHTLLVRAWDLADMAAPQRLIQEKLATIENKVFSPAAIYHTALIVQDDGQRLEKRTLGVTLAELLQSGWTPTRLLERFAPSIVLDPNTIVSGALLGETKQTITISDLLTK